MVSGHKFEAVLASIGVTKIWKVENKSYLMLSMRII